MNSQSCQMMNGDAMQQPGQRADLHRQHEGLEAGRVHELGAVAASAYSGTKMNGWMRLDEDERDHAADDQRSRPQ